MANQEEPEIILYDLACTKNVPFSPVVWRIRLMLNYKRVPYKTVFLEFPDIEPTLKELGLNPGESNGGRYTVPAIHYIPTNTYMIDSQPISQFLESTYPDPPVPLTSELGSKIESEARSAVYPVLIKSVMPREVRILSPRAQEHFRTPREAFLGCKFEDLLDQDKEEQTWSEISNDVQSVGELILTNKAEGPFILGSKPSYTDFFIAGALQSMRVVDEGVFQRFSKFPGFRDVYDACQPYMEKQT